MRGDFAQQPARRSLELCRGHGAPNDRRRHERDQAGAIKMLQYHESLPNGPHSLPLTNTAAAAEFAGNRPLRDFVISLLALDVSLAAGGAIHALLRQIPATIAAPIILAFLAQASVYLVPLVPSGREWFEARFNRRKRPFAIVGFSLLPYLLYAIPTGVFSAPGLMQILALCGFVAFLFVWFPPRRDALCWQDVLILAALALPMISDITPMLERIYVSPAPDIDGLERLDFLGKLMLMSLGAATFLSIRGVEGAGVHLMPTGPEIRTGLREFAYFVPFGIAASLATGFLRWSPRAIDGWTYPFEVLGSVLGIYLTVALAEEMFFRGIIQNLLGKSWGSPLPAQAVAAVLFGLVHLPRGFPNWRFALLAAIAGWFYGRAYAARVSIVPAMVTHTLVVVVMRFGFHRFH